MSESWISSLSMAQISTGHESPLFSKVGGRYESNPWLKNEPRFRCSVDLEWDGEMPDDIKALIKRYEG